MAAPGSGALAWHISGCKFQHLALCTALVVCMLGLRLRPHLRQLAAGGQESLQAMHAYIPGLPSSVYCTFQAATMQFAKAYDYSTVFCMCVGSLICMMPIKAE